MTSNEHGVLVAVGPDGIHDGAIELAAAEARTGGTGVELVHVVHSLVVVPQADVQRAESVDRALTKVGREVLTDAADRMRRRLGGHHQVTTELLTGPVAATIVDRAGGADIVVLERRDVGPVERLVTMSVSSRVAAHARTPVAVVPAHWVPCAEALPVTVGVDHPADALGQVEHAAAYAHLVGRPLVVLHAVWLAEPYQDMVFMDYTRAAWVGDATKQVRSSLRALGDRADPELVVDVRWTRPTEALVEATTTSSVVVLSRRPHGRSSHLGPVTRAVLEHAVGPVLVVDRT